MLFVDYLLVLSFTSPINMWTWFVLRETWLHVLYIHPNTCVERLCTSTAQVRLIIIIIIIKCHHHQMSSSVVVTNNLFSPHHTHAVDQYTCTGYDDPHKARYCCLSCFKSYACPFWKHIAENFELSAYIIFFLSIIANAWKIGKFLCLFMLRLAKLN